MRIIFTYQRAERIILITDTVSRRCLHPNIINLHTSVHHLSAGLPFPNATKGQKAISQSGTRAGRRLRFTPSFMHENYKQ